MTTDRETLAATIKVTLAGYRGYPPIHQRGPDAWAEMTADAIIAAGWAPKPTTDDERDEMWAALQEARDEIRRLRAELTECRQERENWSAYNAKKRELAALRERIGALCEDSYYHHDGGLVALRDLRAALDGKK